MAELLIEALPAEAVDDVAQLSDLSGLQVNVGQELQQSHAAVFVARESKGTAALAYVVLWKVADELQIVDIATAPRHRRRGAARQLLEHVGSLRRHGFSCVLLEVRSSNTAARALYERVGFVELRVRRGYYSDGEDAVEMSWQLTPDSQTSATGAAKRRT